MLWCLNCFTCVHTCLCVIANDLICQVDGLLPFSLTPGFVGTDVSPCCADKLERDAESLSEDGMAGPLTGDSLRPPSLDRGESGDVSSAENRRDFEPSFGLVTAFEFVTGLVTGLVKGLANGLEVARDIRPALWLDGPIRCCDGRGLRCPDRLNDSLSVVLLSACAHGSLGLTGLDTARCLAPGLAGAFEGDHGRMVSSSSASSHLPHWCSNARSPDFRASISSFSALRC